MWRRLRRWSQDLISEGVQIESSLKEWNGSNIMPRHEFRECLTYLGAPIRGESEWYVVWSLRIFFSDVIITSHFQRALLLSEVLEHHWFNLIITTLEYKTLEHDDSNTTGTHSLRRSQTHDLKWSTRNNFCPCFDHPTKWLQSAECYERNSWNVCIEKVAHTMQHNFAKCFDPTIDCVTCVSHQNVLQTQWNRL